MKDSDIQIDNKTLISLWSDEPWNIVFSTASGGELEIIFGDKKISVKTKDCTLNEAAEAFFYKIIKPMADVYIEKRLEAERE